MQFTSNMFQKTNIINIDICKIEKFKTENLAKKTLN